MRATWLRCRGWWGTTRACSTPRLRITDCKTPLMLASEKGHVEVVRWLLDHGAAINGGGIRRLTALFCASESGRLPVARLLLERGADPTTATRWGSTPLMAASLQGHLEVVRMLLGHPSAKATVNQRDKLGRTALWRACYNGHTEIVRALLESGADPSIAHNDGTTPMAIAKQEPPPPLPNHPELTISAEGRRECVAALEVSFCLPLFTCCPDPLSEARGVVWARLVAGGGAGLPAVEGPAGGRPAGERRGGGAERGGGGGGGEGAIGLRGAPSEGGPVSGPDGVYGVRGGGSYMLVEGGGCLGGGSERDHVVPLVGGRVSEGGMGVAGEGGASSRPPLQ
jgi:hypothetical protein